MKTFKVLSVILLSLVLGFFTGRYSVNNVSENMVTQNNKTNKDAELVEQKRPITKVKGKAESNLESKKIVVDTVVIYDTIAYSDTTLTTEVVDSIPFEETIKIKKEKLIETAKLPVKENRKIKNSVADSLLSENLDITTEDRSFYIVEFWSHPLNTKGYKMNGGKLVLYGIDPDLNLTLERDDRGLVLETGAETILLKNAETFQKFTFLH